MKYLLEIDKDNKTNLILKWTDGQTVFDLSQDLEDFFNLYGGGHHNLPSEELVISAKLVELEITLKINTLNVTKSEGTLILQNLNGLLLINEFQEE